MLDQNQTGQVAGGGGVMDSNDPALDFGAIPTFAWLPLESLVIDERYQRKISQDGESMIARIARNFSWSKFSPLTVTGPDASGDYPVIDGQHRMCAARRVSITKLPCWIVEAKDLSRQANTFVAVNKERISVSPISVFWAQLVSKDPKAVWVKSICDQAGIRIGRHSCGDQPPLTIIAISVINRLHPLGDEPIIAGLKMIAGACPDSRSAFRAPVVASAVRIMALLQPIDWTRLGRVFADMDPPDWISRARAFKREFGGSIDLSFYSLIARAYNRNLRSTMPLPDSLPPIPFNSGWKTRNKPLED